MFNYLKLLIFYLVFIGYVWKMEVWPPIHSARKPSQVLVWVNYCICTFINFFFFFFLVRMQRNLGPPMWLYCLSSELGNQGSYYLILNRYFHGLIMVKVLLLWSTRSSTIFSTTEYTCLCPEFLCLSNFTSSCTHKHWNVYH